MKDSLCLPSQIPTPQISDMEENILNTFVAMVMKLSEATFRPILFKVRLVVPLISRSQI